MAAKKNNGWIKWVLALVVIGGGIAGWRWQAGREKAEALDYRTATISRGDILQSVTANGQINPVRNVTVGTQVSGIIKEIHVDYNAQVTNGQVLAVIDPSTYEQSITQSEAELANSKAQLLYAQLNHKRAKELRDADLVAPADYDKTVADLQQAESVVKMRDASLKKANVDLERTVIYAPIDGVVISRNIEVGQTVAASFNTPTLFQIANDLTKMQIEAMVSEADVGGVEDKLRVEFTVDAFMGRKFRGEVRQVRFAPITNQNVVNYSAVIDVRNDDLKLRPGMTATAAIITGEKQDVLRIPTAALSFRPPESALPKAATNAPAKMAAGGGTNETKMAAAGGEEGGRPSREEMQRRFQNMSPEEREAMRARFGGGRGGAGRGGFAGNSGGGRGGQEGPVARTVYLYEKDAAGKVTLKPATVKTGLTDGTNTEVLEGLKEGDVVAVRVNSPMTAMTPPGGSSPFGGSPFGGGRGMGGGSRGGR